MTDEEEKLLKQTLETSRETLKIVKKIHGAQKRARWFKTLKWLFIIAMSLGAYYYLQPIIASLIETLQSIIGDVSTLGEAGKSLEKLQNILPR